MTSSKLKPFDEASDLDIALISSYYFETAWRDLREASQPTLDEIPGGLRSNLRYQKMKLFDGAIVATKMMPFLSFSKEWLGASIRVEQKLSIELGREVDVNIWLYKDYWSLRNYISGSVVKCRGEIG